MSEPHLETMEMLQQRLAEVIEAVTADPRLALAALANPILALEDSGYTVGPAVAAEIEERARFDKRDMAQRRRLRSEIHELAGRAFDVGDERQLAAQLARLELGAEDELIEVVRRPRFHRDRRHAPEDPLIALQGRHAVIAPLLEFRRLDATRPTFAPAEVFAAIKNGELDLPLTSVKFRPADRGDR